jgi:hypothetical protein
VAIRLKTLRRPAFFDEMVMEQAHGDEALLKGGVGESVGVQLIHPGRG